MQLYTQSSDSKMRISRVYHYPRQIAHLTAQWIVVSRLHLSEKDVSIFSDCSNYTGTPYSCDNLFTQMKVCWWWSKLSAWMLECSCHDFEHYLVALLTRADAAHPESNEWLLPLFVFYNFIETIIVTLDNAALMYMGRDYGVVICSASIAKWCLLQILN